MIAATVAAAIDKNAVTPIAGAAVEDDELIKIHFHTNEPWKVLEYCSQIGEIYDIVIEDMDRQARGLKG